MPIRDPDVFTWIVHFVDVPRRIVRPSLSMVFYTRGDYARVKAAVARALEIYFARVPAHAIAAIQGVMNPWTGNDWRRFGAAERQALLATLRDVPEDEADFELVLSATLDGQAGDHGVRCSAINFALVEDEDDAESVFRLDFPWNLLDTLGEVAVVDLYAELARLFPSCSGYAGLSFIHTTTFMPQSSDQIEALARRFLGFDLAHDYVALDMRGKVLTAQWLNLLDAERVAALGGVDRIARALPGCELRRVDAGVLIRAARLPPVADVEHGTPDVGKLPDVARLLAPIRVPNGLTIGMGDLDRNGAWLTRYDALPAGAWDNA